MYRRILIAVDAAHLADSAIPVAAEIAKRSDAEVVVVHVRDIENELGSREESFEIVDGAVGRLAALGIRAAGEVRSIAHGHLAQEIARAAREHEADLVALGSHGRGDLGALLLGSVSHRVAALLDVPVLIVRPAGKPAPYETGQEARISRVLAAVPAGGEAKTVADAAVRVARRRQAQVRVFHVREAVALAEGAAYVEPDEDARTAVGIAAERLAAAGVAVETEISGGIGSIAHEIAAAADRWNADLIILGSRRPTDLGGLLLGSVAHQVIHISRRPVLLAERTAQPEEKVG